MIKWQAEWESGLGVGGETAPRDRGPKDVLCRSVGVGVDGGTRNAHENLQMQQERQQQQQLQYD